MHITSLVPRHPSFFRLRELVSSPAVFEYGWGRDYAAEKAGNEASILLHGAVVLPMLYISSEQGKLAYNT